MKYVEILRGFAPYARGDRCAFPPARADALIRTGFAAEVPPPIVEEQDDLAAATLASADGPGDAPAAARRRG